MHTKKTNNTNKLPFCPNKNSKITKLTKKKKKKNFFLYQLVLASIARNWPVWPVFFPVRNRGVIYTGLLASTVYSSGTDRYSRTVRNWLPWLVSTFYFVIIFNQVWVEYLIVSSVWSELRLLSVSLVLVSCLRFRSGYFEPIYFELVYFESMRLEMTWPQIQ